MDGMYRRRNYVPDDDNGNLELLDHRLGAGSVARYEYGYDRNGMRTSMVDNNGLHDYVYDTLYQIVSATHPTVTNPTETFEYDAAGNRLLDETRAYSYNDLNQLTEGDEYEYEYDLDGNMVFKVEKATGDSTKYTWDIENRLVRVEKAGTVAEYSYGPLGRRLAKTVNGTTTEFRYDGEDLILATDDAGTITASWTFGPGIDQPLAMNRSGVNHYYLADGLGSVVALTDAAGAAVQTYEYGVFGEITEQTGSLDNPFAYTGREWEPEVGLYYYRARWYDAGAGRFASEDPMSYAAGDVSLYRYASACPTRFTDPTGLCREEGESLWECTNRRVDEDLVGPVRDVVAWSDALGFYGMASMAVGVVTSGGLAVAEKGLQLGSDEITHWATSSAVGYAERAGRFAAGLKIDKVLQVAKGATKFISQVSGVVGAVGTGISLGARASYLAECTAECPITPCP